MCDHCGCRDLTPVARLTDEHDRLRELSEAVRRNLIAGDAAAARGHFEEILNVLGPEAWRDGALRLLTDLSEHMYKEDFGLFPAALATLDGANWDAMDPWEQQHLTRGVPDRARPAGPSR